jgi:subtilisin family serine protease
MAKRKSSRAKTSGKKSTSRKRSTASRQPSFESIIPVTPGMTIPPFEPGPPGSTITGAQTTGRFVIVYRDEVLKAPKEAIRTLESVGGIAAKNVVSALDFKDAAVDARSAERSDALYLPALGVAVVSAEQANVQAVMSAAADRSSNILAVEPEWIYHALAPPPTLQLDYLRGYRDAVNYLYDQLSGAAGVAEGIEARAAFQDTAQFTWGLQATRVDTSTFSGAGVRVAVLDTGLDFQHPDFIGRPTVSESFIPNQSAQDLQSHGTHCIGTSCGPKTPPTGVRRYGVAFGAEIFVGKVLSNSGSSVDSSVLLGMNWAVTNRCQVISMSLGADVTQVSQAFEQAGRRALDAGCLIIAAAGNNAGRALGNFGFVGQPANSPSIMAVGAVDSQLRVADFSARSNTEIAGDAGKVDIAGPGVAVFSSVPTHRGVHASFNGTSMATPHVAGIAALWCQAKGQTGHALWNLLVQNIRPISGNVLDIGAGLVQAPQ